MTSSADSSALALVHRMQGAARPLTIPQAMRLFGLREGICRRVLGALVTDGVLWKRHDERYVSRALGL